MSQGPRTLAGYTLIRELGRGGMGVVYEVQDPKLGRSLAMKLVLGSQADAETLLRFEREAELLARVKHPNVVRIHGVGVCESGPYFVADRVEGSPLDRVLERHGAWAGERAAALVRDLASAVSALHAEGIIHRDLKPGNVILRPDGSPVLIDFGLARDSQGQSLTLTGALLGTPNYMSPEQALAQRHEVGPASDVYALGGVLFTLLTGSAPFAGLSQLAVLDAITRVDPTWPAEAKARVAPALQTLCQEAMSKDPDARPTAAALEAGLQALLNSPLAPRGVSSSRTGLLVGLAALALGGVAAAAWFAFGPGSAPSAPSPEAVEASSPDLANSTPLEGRAELSPTPPGLTAREVARELRKLKAEPALFDRAQELLAEPGAADYSLLRARYVRARLADDPAQRLATLELPMLGMAEWVDDTRLVLTSKTVNALYRWPDWRAAAYDKVDHTSGIKTNARPAVSGERALTGGKDATGWTARCYDWTSPKPLRTYAAATLVTALAVAEVAGRPVLAVGTRGLPSEERGTILIYDLEGGQLLRTLRGHRRGIRGIAGAKGRVQQPPEVGALQFSPDGRWLLSGGFAGDLVLWDVSDWTEKTGRSTAWGDVRDLAIHPQGSLLAVSAGFQKSVRVVRLPSLEVEREFEHLQGKPSSVTFSRDGRLLFATSRQVAKKAWIGELLAYDLEEGRIVHARPYDQQAPNSVALSPDGRRLAVCSQGPSGFGVFEVYQVDVPPRE